MSRKGHPAPAAGPRVQERRGFVALVAVLFVVASITGCGESVPSAAQPGPVAASPAAPQTPEGAINARPAASSERATAPAPLRVPDLDGRPVDPFGGQESAATVFLFVSTDCPIANRYAPVIRQLDESYRARHVAFWLVYADPHEDAGAIRQHRSDYRHKTPALRDPEHLLVRYCQATRTPEAALFNARRELVYHGRIDDQYTDFGKAHAAPSRHDLRDAIEEVLAGGRVKEPYLKPIGCYIATSRE